MPRGLNLLPSTILKNAKDGWHHDGAGLYLRVDGDRKAWVLRFQWLGKPKNMGLGSAADVDLKTARKLAEDARRVLATGHNPIEHRKAARAAQEAFRPKTFGEVATDLLDGLEGGWKNRKHRQQWRNTLTGYCKPIWDRPVDEITTDDVLSILRPLWTKVPETASRLRGRIERVLDAAKAHGYRSGENVARWRGQLALFLPKPKKRSQKRHHPAMPFAELPAFLAELRTRRALAARALEWTILTAARSGETLGATWSEIDLSGKVWTVPAERMKAGVEHKVPLCDRAVEIAAELAKRSNRRPGAKVFPGAGKTGQLSNMSMEMLLRRMDLDCYTVHGFRSTFRDWVGECTEWSDRLAEQALAHQLSNAVEAAYRRGTAFEKRRIMMSEWGDFCAGRAVVEIGEAQSA